MSQAIPVAQLKSVTMSIYRYDPSLDEKPYMQSYDVDTNAFNGKMLLDALNEIAMGSGASGFDSFMEQMNQLSNQQQGLNQSSMQLGKMGMMGQLDLMQQLQLELLILK